MRSTDTRVAGGGQIGDKGATNPPKFDRLTICGAEMVAPKPIGLPIRSSVPPFRADAGDIDV
jgi:hypothetical protein